MKKNIPYPLGEEQHNGELHSPIADYCVKSNQGMRSLFELAEVETAQDDIRVVELFAGVGGFRVGLERASDRFKTVWSNQWEPETKRQDASIIYAQRWGLEGHSNNDINTVPTEDIPQCDLLVGGFPCQDYSVATTLNRSGGIEGKKGVLWWQIYRILNEMEHRPQWLFFENVDRLLKSPATQRGRDFAIILASLSDLGYDVEWRVINAAEYGMPQRRRRTYIVGYRQPHPLTADWVLRSGVFAEAFPVTTDQTPRQFTIDGTLDWVSQDFNRVGPVHTLENAGYMSGRRVITVATQPVYHGPWLTLGDIVIDEKEVPEEFFIPDEQLEKWQYLKGSKTLMRRNAQGYEYRYSEGGMAFPDPLDRPSRTIITGEGGQGPSRFKHVVLTPSGRYRRLTPLELERLNMFPDHHTEGASDLRRAFLMGNALVTGVVEKVALSMLRHLS